MSPGRRAACPAVCGTAVAADSASTAACLPHDLGALRTTGVDGFLFQGREGEGGSQDLRCAGGQEGVLSEGEWGILGAHGSWGGGLEVNFSEQGRKNRDWGFMGLGTWGWGDGEYEFCEQGKAEREEQRQRCVSMFSGQFASWVRFPFNHGDNDQWRAGFGFPLSMVTMTSGLWPAGFGFPLSMVTMTSGLWPAGFGFPLSMVTVTSGL